MTVDKPRVEQTCADCQLPFAETALHWAGQDDGQPQVLVCILCLMARRFAGDEHDVLRG